MHGMEIGRGANWLGRSRAERSCRLASYEDLGISNSISRRESWTPHSTRFSWQCSSAKSKAILSQGSITSWQKGNWLKFQSGVIRRGNASAVLDALG